MIKNILFGGQAGQGPNILTHILGQALIEKGYFVFYSRDYQSLIRGGHNFNVLTFSDEPVNSNESKIDILVALDENTRNLHEKNLKEGGKILEGEYENMYFAGALFKILGLDFELLEEQFKKLGKRIEENINIAKQGYEKEDKGEIVDVVNKEFEFISGNQGVSIGAIKSGLDIYYAYPMTPSTTVLGELAGKQIENNNLVLELENEIAVINAGIGSAITGAKTMVGTSGGGFDLMTEGISLTGIAEVPLVIFLCQRPGPGTGVATYTSQGDLNIARHAGHGEFQRVVLAPGNPIEAQELTSQAFYFSQKYKIPAIIISDKHLGESFYSDVKKAEITDSEKSTNFGRYNSYEKDENGSATENSEIIQKNILKRKGKISQIEQDAERFEQYKIYGNKNSENVVMGWGSPTGAILDAIKDLDVKFIQILYIEPFPKKIKEELKEKNIILVENNSTGQLGELIAEKTGIFINKENKILRFDGRGFLSDELKLEIKGRLK
jgi:2-oxoglutarate ferredoxin oxidoreductase subunit alpha